MIITSLQHIASV